MVAVEGGECGVMPDASMHVEKDEQTAPYKNGRLTAAQDGKAQRATSFSRQLPPDVRQGEQCKQRHPLLQSDTL